jgi:hypothetical protein
VERNRKDLPALAREEAAMLHLAQSGLPVLQRLINARFGWTNGSKPRLGFASGFIRFERKVDG